VPLHPPILLEGNGACWTAGLLPHVPLQLVHLRVDRQVNGFMGCDCHIEVFFRVRKQGCQIEQLRLQTKPRVVNAIAVYLIVAWRIHTLTMLSRAYPEVSCEVVFEPQEWQTIDMMQYRRRPPQESPPLREIVRGLARLAGFLARTGDGAPGVQTIWQGYQRLHDFLYALETHRALTAS
jgi:Transposase Tn5 dimerisation domain